MGEQRTGRTVKMLIVALQYAADNPGSSVLVCGKESQVRPVRNRAEILARAMGFTVSDADIWSFRIERSVLRFRPAARSRQHVEKLKGAGEDPKVFFDHTTSGELES